ncbi:PREDICTED: histone deacetylase [Prunus dulcis]|uniref:PREDICTED: histone deacetylase n=3 Tax=Prunus TaxID=3754 RepID=A0A5E4FA66_PRUDU|nr:PREDICTED: histone deacetylase [Prunus dulcis]
MENREPREPWGVKVKSGDSVVVEAGTWEILYLTEAHLDDVKKAKGSDPIELYFTITDGELDETNVSKTIPPESFEKPCNFDEIEIAYKIELSHNWKYGSIRFTGHKCEATSFILGSDMAVYTDSDADDFEDDLRIVLFSDQGRSAKRKRPVKKEQYISNEEAARIWNEKKSHIIDVINSQKKFFPADSVFVGKLDHVQNILQENKGFLELDLMDLEKYIDNLRSMAADDSGWPEYYVELKKSLGLEFSSQAVFSETPITYKNAMLAPPVTSFNDCSDELDSDICCEEAEKLDAQKSVIVDAIGRLKTLGTIPPACSDLLGRLEDMCSSLARYESIKCRKKLSDFNDYICSIKGKADVDSRWIEMLDDLQKSLGLENNPQVFLSFHNLLAT